MGIRIHKSIGYGLAPVGKDILTSEEWKEQVYDDFSEFRKLLENKDLCMEILTDIFHYGSRKAEFQYFNIEMFLNRHKKLISYELFDYDCEHPEDFIVFYPVNNISNGKANFSKWQRYDDSIDYYENRVYKKDLGTVVIDLSEYGACGLYPYDHGMFLKPNRVNKTNFDEGHMDAGTYNVMVGNWDKNQKPMANEETINHLKEDWHCGIPVSIPLFIHHFNIFNNPLDVFNLKPLLCQWWG